MLEFLSIFVRSTSQSSVLCGSVYYSIGSLAILVRVPEQLMRAMAAEAEAARNARAKVIAAEGEHKASRALRHAAEIISDCPAALQVCLNVHI